MTLRCEKCKKKCQNGYIMRGHLFCNDCYTKDKIKEGENKNE